MKHTIKGLVALVLFSVGASLNASVALYQPRSQSRREFRDLVGSQSFLNRCDYDQYYTVFDATLQYERSFRGNRIARCIFGSDVVVNAGCATACATDCDSDCDDSTACLVVSGSRFGGGALNNGRGRGSNDWLAEYFGLAPDFKSVICFAPRIQNFNADLSFHVGFGDDCLNGLFFAIHAPITWTKWELNATESVEDKGSLGYVEGYFTSEAVANGTLLDGEQGALQFLADGAAPTLDANTTFNPLGCCKFSRCDCESSCNTKTRLSDIEATLGWNIFCDDDHHFGVSVKASAPTGNKPCGDLLFEPIVGSGGHWKLGAGFTHHKMLWESEDQDRSLGVWIEGTAWHLFETCQTRCFDLCGKPNSRYALAMRVDGANATAAALQGVRGQSVNGTLATSIFAREYTPVANLTKQTVNVSVPLEGSLAIKFAYACNNFEFDLGYEYWGRSCEKICRRLDSCTAQFAENTWALKGDAHVFGFTTNETITGTTRDDDPVPLSATNCRATVHGGTNRTSNSLAATGRANAVTNPNIDNAVDPAGNAFGNDALGNTTHLNAVTGGTIATDQTRTSIQPHFISRSDMHMCGSKGSSHTIFGHFNYIFECEEADYSGFVGVGASVELNGRGDDFDNFCFSNACRTDCGVQCDKGCTSIADCGSCDDGDCCGPSCEACPDCAPSMWSVWVKGGIAFN